MSTWEDQLWVELGSLPKAESMVLAAEYITDMQRILSELARYRRLAAVDMVGNGYTYGQLADAIGAGHQTVQRLIEEGRKILRSEASTHEAEQLAAVA
jgi:DNA-directed RNA polymerase specialized sigma24 family protein